MAKKKHWHGQDTKEVCELEGYPQMEWEGSFGPDTLFHYYREQEGFGTIVSEHTTANQVWKDAHGVDRRSGKVKMDVLREFASDLKDMKEVPANPYDTLRLVHSYDSYYGL